MRKWLLALGGALLAFSGTRRETAAAPAPMLPDGTGTPPPPLVGPGGVVIDTAAPVPPPLPTQGPIDPRTLPPVVLPSRDVDTLARTAWGEARGDGPEGMQAVCNVVMNRVRDRRWPDSAHAVCVQPFQFSMWNTGDPNGEKARAVDRSDPLFADALALADYAVIGRLPDITGGANHYFAPSVVLPGWAAGMAKVAEIGGHRFMRG